MPESTFSRLKSEIIDGETGDRLKAELRDYLEARARKTISDVGSRLGRRIGDLAEPGSGAGSVLGALAKGTQKLSEGGSPAAALTSAGVSHLKDTVKDKVKGLFGKGRKGGGGKSKSVTIVEDIDVGVPVREAYDQWTQFQEFSGFAKGVVSVEKADDTTSNWRVKVAKSTRSWKANITEQVPDERIAWTTQGAKGTVKGVVTFHRLEENLTRVLLVLEYFPHGLFEKTGNIWRAQGRRARLDLKLYRKFIMMRGEATDGWRGEIRDGEVVRDHDEAVAEEERDREARDADDTGEPEAEDAGAEDRDSDAEDAEDAEDTEGAADADDDPREDDADPEDELDDGDADFDDEADDLDDDRYDDEAEPDDEADDEYEDEEYEDEEEDDQPEPEPEPESRPAARRSRRRASARR